VPAPAVIPAPMVYIKVAAVKTLVVRPEGIWAALGPPPGVPKDDLSLARWSPSPHYGGSSGFPVTPESEA